MKLFNPRRPGIRCFTPKPSKLIHTSVVALSAAMLPLIYQATTPLFTNIGAVIDHKIVRDFDTGDINGDGNIDFILTDYDIVQFYESLVAQSIWVCDGAGNRL